MFASMGLYNHVQCLPMCPTDLEVGARLCLFCGSSYACLAQISLQVISCVGHRGILSAEVIGYSVIRNCVSADKKCRL